VLTQSWRSKSAVFRMYHALTLNGNSNIINAVKRQKNLGLSSTLQKLEGNVAKENINVHIDQV
jgi:hypothetical protein